VGTNIGSPPNPGEQPTPLRCARGATHAGRWAAFVSGYPETPISILPCLMVSLVSTSQLKTRPSSSFEVVAVLPSCCCMATRKRMSAGIGLRRYLPSALPSSVPTFAVMATLLNRQAILNTSLVRSARWRKSKVVHGNQSRQNGLLAQLRAPNKEVSQQSVALERFSVGCGTVQE
jgi:hypothetical protein